MYDILHQINLEYVAVSDPSVRAFFHVYFLHEYDFFHDLKKN